MSTRSQTPTPSAPVARRLARFGTTIFAEITQRALAADAINLGQGMPDFDGPDWLKDAAARAMRDHPNQYAPMPGVPALRRALADRWARLTNRAIDPDTQVTVTAGCTEAISACTLGLLEPGDRVVVFEPSYDAYAAALAIAGAEPVFVPLHAQPDGSFAFDPDDLTNAVDGRTRAVILNTPHNPTGKVFTRAELETIADLCLKHDLFAISDEVYENLVFDGFEHVRLATLPGMGERTITLGSFGKMFSMTGWKIGWAIAPPVLTRGVRSAHQYLTYAVATPLQHAAAEAIADDRGYADELVRDLSINRDRLVDALRDVGFTVSPPGGSYFVLAEHAAVCARLGIDPADDVTLCHRLIDDVGVASIPPSAFCRDPELCKRLLRFAFCQTPEGIDAAIDRLRTLA